MSQSPNKRYTAIFYSSLLITAVLLIGVMVSNRSTPAADTAKSTAAGTQTTKRTTAGYSAPMEITFYRNAEQLRSMMNEAAADSDMGVEIDELTLEAPDLITISGSVERSTLETLLAESDIEGKSTFSMALKLLPASMEGTIALQVTVEDGRLNVLPQSFEAGNINLPVELLSEDLITSINDAINNSLDEQNYKREYKLKSLIIEDNTLNLTCEVG